MWRDLQTEAVAWRIWSDSGLGNAPWVSDPAGPTELSLSPFNRCVFSSSHTVTRNRGIGGPQTQAAVAFGSQWPRQEDPVWKTHCFLVCPEPLLDKGGDCVVG